MKTSSTTSAPDPLLPRRSLAFAMTVVLALFMLGLAVNGAFNAIGAAHGFGVDLASPLDAFYLHVKADRDLAIFGVLVALIAYGRTVPILLAVGALCVAPIIDCALVASTGRLGYALLVHGSAAAYGLVLIALLRRACRKTPA